MADSVSVSGVVVEGEVLRPPKEREKEKKEKEEMEKERLAIEVCMGQYVLTRKDPDPFICYRQKKHVREAHQSR